MNILQRIRRHINVLAIDPLYWLEKMPRSPINPLRDPVTRDDCEKIKQEGQDPCETCDNKNNDLACHNCPTREVYCYGILSGRQDVA